MADARKVELKLARHTAAPDTLLALAVRQADAITQFYQRLRNQDIEPGHATVITAAWLGTWRKRDA